MPVDEVVSEQATEALRPLDHNTSRRPGRSLASFVWGYVFNDRTTPCSLKNHGNPLPELIAFATCDVLGRFSAGCQSWASHGMIIYSRAYRS